MKGNTIEGALQWAPINYHERSSKDRGLKPVFLLSMKLVSI